MSVRFGWTSALEDRSTLYGCPLSEFDEDAAGVIGSRTARANVVSNNRIPPPATTGFDCATEQIGGDFLVHDDTHKKWEIGLIGGPEKRVIEIVPYDRNWVYQFREHRARIEAALGSVSRRIEHIGSTSVEGLAAKPIIDILVVVADPAYEDLYVPAMLSAGYQLRVREPEFDQHRMFRTPQRDAHIHFFAPLSGEIDRYLIFRDFLRAHPTIRAQYATLKKKLGALDWNDMNEYAEAKGHFIEDVIRQGRA